VIRYDDDGVDYDSYDDDDDDGFSYSFIACSYTQTYPRLFTGSIRVYEDVVGLPHIAILGQDGNVFKTCDMKSDVYDMSQYLAPTTHLSCFTITYIYTYITTSFLHNHMFILNSQMS
jgi:hypothetical protein